MRPGKILVSVFDFTGWSHYKKHVYSNKLEIFTTPKKKNFQMKKSNVCHVEYPQSMFWAEIRKLMYTPVNPSFTVKSGN